MTHHKILGDLTTEAGEKLTLPEGSKVAKVDQQPYTPTIQFKDGILDITIPYITRTSPMISQGMNILFDAIFDQYPALKETPNLNKINIKFNTQFTGDLDSGQISRGLLQSCLDDFLLKLSKNATDLKKIAINIENKGSTPGVPGPDNQIVGTVGELTNRIIAMQLKRIPIFNYVGTLQALLTGTKLDDEKQQQDPIDYVELPSHIASLISYCKENNISMTGDRHDEYRICFSCPNKKVREELEKYLDGIEFEFKGSGDTALYIPNFKTVKDGEYLKMHIDKSTSPAIMQTINTMLKESHPSAVKEVLVQLKTSLETVATQKDRKEVTPMLTDATKKDLEDFVYTKPQGKK